MANQFTSSMSKSIGTAPVSVYTATASSQTTLIGMTVANLTTAVVTADVYITRAGVDYYISKGFDIIPASTQILIGGDQKIVLQPSDIVKVVSNTATAVDVILSMLIIT